jgi:hypothetical protein
MENNIMSNPTKTELDNAVEKRFISLIKENPTELVMWMLIQMGKMCVESNAESMDLKQCSTFGKQRYQVKAKITIEKVPIDTP